MEQGRGVCVKKNKIENNIYKNKVIRWMHMGNDVAS